jgi:serine phosphatase RsbU (regulator of sigma subunit)
MRDLLLVNDQLSSKDLFDAFKRQLIKDFEQSNFQADFIKDLEPDYASIQEKIIGELQHSEKRTDSNLMTLLYRIDISEAQLKKYLNERSNENHLITIAELIIKRVLQKVVIKQYYKKNKNQ